MQSAPVMQNTAPISNSITALIQNSSSFVVPSIDKAPNPYPGETQRKKGGRLDPSLNSRLQEIGPRNIDPALNPNYELNLVTNYRLGGLQLNPRDLYRMDQNPTPQGPMSAADLAPADSGIPASVPGFMR